MRVKAKTMPVPLEKDIQRAILDYLKLRGHRAYRRNTGAMSGRYKGKGWFVRFSEPGQSDIWGVKNDGSGIHFEIEVKRPGEKPTPVQEQWLADMSKAGCIALVATSVEDVRKVGL